MIRFAVVAFAFLTGLLLPGCYINDISFGPPPRKEVEVPSSLSARVSEQIRDLEKATGLELALPYRITVVEAVHIDSEGVPLGVSPNNRGAAGWTEFENPIILTFPVAEAIPIPTRVIRHECLHAILLSNGIVGHPEQYKHLAWHWRTRR